MIVRRVVLRKLTQRRYMQAFGHIQAHVSHLDEVSDPRPADQVDRQDEVDSLMSTLPNSLRRVARLFYLEQLSYKQIADRMKWPINSIGPALSRARNLLQKQSESQPGS